MQPRYSVILPVFNGGEYVKKCVNSILAQSFTGFELLVLDNCSTDGTSEWITSTKDSRIKIFRSERKLSITENWARILSVPRQEFITLIGHDDYLEPDYLQVMDQLISVNPEAVLYQSHFRFIDSAGDVIRTCRRMPAYLSGSDFTAGVLSRSIDVMGTGFMMRSADYNKAGGIPLYPNLLFSDFSLWLSLAAEKGIAIAENDCFCFRLHQSVSKTSVTPDFIKAFFLFLQSLKDLKSKSEAQAAAVASNANYFIRFYGMSLTHRLLKTPVAQREGFTVKEFITACTGYAMELCPQKPLNLSSSFSVRMAKAIDSNPVIRSMYIGFRRIFKKPFTEK